MILIFITIFSFSGFANADVYNQLERIAPHLTQIEKLNLALDIIKVCEHEKIDCRTFTAVLAQESMFRTSAFNLATSDYGIGQVNHRNIVSMRLDKKRMLEDRLYALKASAQIFGYFQRRYGAKESMWACRYNVGTRNLDENLKSACAKYVLAIKKFL